MNIINILIHIIFAVTCFTTGFFSNLSLANYPNNLDLYENNKAKEHLKTFEYDYYKTLRFSQDKRILAFTIIGFGNTGSTTCFMVIYESENSTGLYPTVFDFDNRGPFAVKFLKQDVNADGIPELIVRYMLGVRIHVLRIYTISDKYDTPLRWDGDFEGESYDPEIKDGFIVCTSTSLTDPKIRIKKYKIKKGGANLFEDKVKEKK